MLVATGGDANKYNKNRPVPHRIILLMYPRPVPSVIDLSEKYIARGQNAINT